MALKGLTAPLLAAFTPTVRTGRPLVALAAVVGSVLAGSVLLSCEREYKDEDLVRNEKREVLINRDEIPDINIRGMRGWHLEGTATAKQWIFKATPFQGEQAFIRITMQEDPKYQFNLPDIKVKLDMAMLAWKEAEFVRGSDSFALLKEDVIGIQEMQFLKQKYLFASMMVYVDRERPDSNSGDLRVRQVAIIWEKGRAFTFYMITTVDGYKALFRDQFTDLLKSFRSERILGMTEEMPQ